MQKLTSIIFLLGCLCIIWSGCEKDPATNNNNNNSTSCENTFSTLGSFTDSRDGNVYQTVAIGNQTWMAENLRFNATNSILNPNNPCEKFGRLYDWATVMNGAASSSSNPSGVQGICPSGWHLPSDAEWSQLEIHLGMSISDTSTVGLRGNHALGLKSTITWDSNSGTEGTNSTGFHALPATYYASGSYYGLGQLTYFLSSTEVSSTNAWARVLYHDEVSVLRSSDIIKPAGMSCRCIQD